MKFLLTRFICNKIYIFISFYDNQVNKRYLLGNTLEAQINLNWCNTKFAAA